MEGNALSALGTVVTQIGTWMGSVVDIIVAEPVLLLPVGIFVFGACIGLASRLIGR